MSASQVHELAGGGADFNGPRILQRATPARLGRALFRKRKEIVAAVRIGVFKGSALVVTVAMPCMASAMSVALEPSTASPAPVGTVITWTATVSDANSGTLWYRFRGHAIGGGVPVL